MGENGDEKSDASSSASWLRLGTRLRSLSHSTPSLVCLAQLGPVLAIGQAGCLIFSDSTVGSPTHTRLETCIYAVARIMSCSGRSVEHDTGSDRTGLLGTSGMRLVVGVCLSQLVLAGQGEGVTSVGFVFFFSVQVSYSLLFFLFWGFSGCYGCVSVKDRGKFAFTLVPKHALVGRTTTEWSLAFVCLLLSRNISE